MTPYSDYVMADGQRTGRWSLAMAWWALFSAMFWLYIAVASAGAVGMTDTIIGMVLTIASYGAINAVLARFGARTGLTVELFSRSLFGVLGSAVATLIFAATAIYYAVFEGSVIAVAFQSYFGGPIKIWYLAVVVYALPLVAGGVQNWLDRLNGWLLPFYCAGLIAAVIATAARAGTPRVWPHGTATGIPGWLSSYLIYMGVYIMMMYTFDYARHGRPRDERFHANVTFGWVFYLFTFAVNGLIGIYLVYTWGEGGTETGVAQAMVKALGFVGLLVIFVSQTRINSANYYLASTNLDAFASRVFRLKLPRWAWVIVSGVIAYIFMLTNVLSYLLKALAWQGVFVTAWVAIALVYIGLSRRTAGALSSGTLPPGTPSSGTLPEVTERRLPPLTAGAFVWVLASAIGIYLTQQKSSADLAALAPLITVAIAAGGYLITYQVQPPVTRPEHDTVAVGEPALPSLISLNDPWSLVVVTPSAREAEGPGTTVAGARLDGSRTGPQPAGRLQQGS
ncbi:MAG: purine-cytosine permease family protein [Trebonia sp.]